MKSICLAALFFALVAAVCCQDAASTRQCYVCNSKEDISCAGDSSERYSGMDKHKAACTNGETFCRKVVQIVEGERSIIRQCAKNLYKENYEGCYKTAGKATQQVCTCKDDLCNSAISFKSSVFAVSLSIIVAALIF